jgi:hypothetical protein
VIHPVTPRQKIWRVITSASLPSSSSGFRSGQKPQAMAISESISPMTATMIAPTPVEERAKASTAVIVEATASAASWLACKLKRE